MGENADIILEARGLRKAYDAGGRDLEVLKGVDLEVRAGELIAVMGASGVGKSTLLHLLGTLDRPSGGELRIANTDVLALEDRALSRFRNRHIGFVFQSHHLLPEFTALENVLMPAIVAGCDMPAEAAALMGSVGLNDRMDHRPGELSGGECQRVVARRCSRRRLRQLWPRSGHSRDRPPPWRHPGTDPVPGNCPGGVGDSQPH